VVVPTLPRPPPLKRPAVVNARVGGLLGVEKRFLDCGAANILLASPTDASGGRLDPTVGCTQCISAPARGDGASNRDGKQITCKFIEVKGTVQYPRTTVTVAGFPTGITVFIALILDRQTNATALLTQDVFTQAGVASAELAPHVMRNLSNGSRFKILKSVTIDFPPIPATGTLAAAQWPGTSRTFYFFVPFQDMLLYL